jgi:MFS family permease
MRKVLELSVFRRLLVATVLNELAYSIGTVALALLVYRRTGSAIGAAGFFLCSQFGPALVSPALVARLDRRPARQTLALLYTVEALIFLALAGLVRHFSVAPALVLILVDGVMALTARVVARATWTSVTAPQGLMREANALINTSIQGCSMIGPALGGAAVAVGGTRGALIVNVWVFVLVTLTVLTARGFPEPRTGDGVGIRRVRTALAYTRTEPLIRNLLGLEGVGVLFFTVSIPVEVILAQHVFHAGAGGYGALLATWGAGAVTGSALYTRWRRLPSGPLMTVGACLLGCGFLTMSLSPSLAVAAAGAVLAGLGNGVQGVAARTAIQEATPDRWMSLVLSLAESMFQGVPGLGILLGGAVAAAAGPRVALAVAAGGCLAVAAATPWLLRQIFTLKGGIAVASPRPAHEGQGEVEADAVVGEVDPVLRPW